jgi:hypothetical protein
VESRPFGFAQGRLLRTERARIKHLAGCDEKRSKAPPKRSLDGPPSEVKRPRQIPEMTPVISSSGVVSVKFTNG